jgi:hypothetical protein
MVKGDLWHEIHSRRKLKESKKSIARTLQLDIKTVRKILRQKQPQVYSRARQEGRLLRPYREYVLQRLAAMDYCAQAIYEELQVRGYQGSYDIVKRFVSPLRQEAEIEATVRFETPPGQQGQADWGQCWTIIAGKRVKVHLFVLTLGYKAADVLCGDTGREDAGLPAVPRGGFRVPRRRHARDRLRQPEVGRSGPRLRGLAVRVEPGLLGLQPVLRLQSGAALALPAPDQGQGRIGRQVRQALPQGQGVFEPRRSQRPASRLDLHLRRPAHPRHDPPEAFRDVPRGEGPPALSEGPAGLCPRGALAEICPEGLSRGLPDQPLFGSLPSGGQARRGPDRWGDDQDLSRRRACLQSSAARGDISLVGRPGALRGLNQSGQARRGASGRRRGQGPRPVYERLLEGGAL